MRALAIIFGVLLLLPGLCFLGFGLAFTFDKYMTSFGLTELAIGAVLTGVAIVLFVSGR